MNEQDHAMVQEDPPPKRMGPLQRNLEKAMATPGTSWRIATYDSRLTATKTASHLRTGVRPVPEGTTVAQWRFESGEVRDQPKKFGIWATFIPTEEE